MSTGFVEYVAKGRRCGQHSFDFLITDETARLWYDASSNQNMPERHWCLENIRPGATVLDCGAHHGMMSVLFALTAGPTGRVIAFEALPENAEVVRRNAALNGLSNVEVRAKAVGSGPSERLYHRNMGNVTITGPALEEASSGTMTIAALDDEIPPDLHVDFLKMDVEGSELEALRGARGLLARRPIVDLELHNFLFADRRSTLGEIFAILDGHGYRYRVLPKAFDPVRDLDSSSELDWLATMDNPHVFCTPR